MLIFYKCAKIGENANVDYTCFIKKNCVVLRNIFKLFLKEVFKNRTDFNFYKNEFGLKLTQINILLPFISKKILCSYLLYCKDLMSRKH